MPSLVAASSRSSSAMTSETQAVVDFCRLLARTRKRFRQSHISVESSGRFANVSCTTSHGEKELVDGNSRNRSVEISFSLDSELHEVLRDGRYSLGVSVAIYNVDGVWKCYGDVGWSCRDTGWQEILSEEVDFVSLEQMKTGFLGFVERILVGYEGLVNGYSQ
ncbi:hypothetical protein [Blastopirellula marina]|uniref:hypothetical protein n=1 Tax=Blastopirellula marina TaxID=124 RepID=UPI0011B067DB|nr:hypothetical protein [Blastopirellula marina]